MPPKATGCQGLLPAPRPQQACKAGAGPAPMHPALAKAIASIRAPAAVLACTRLCCRLCARALLKPLGGLQPRLSGASGHPGGRAPTGLLLPALVFASSACASLAGFPTAAGLLEPSLRPLSTSPALRCTEPSPRVFAKSQLAGGTGPGDAPPVPAAKPAAAALGEHTFAPPRSSWQLQRP